MAVTGSTEQELARSRRAVAYVTPYEQPSELVPAGNPTSTVLGTFDH